MPAARNLTTLYLRGIPAQLAREAKAAAARSGSTLARFVSETLSRSLETATPPRDDDEAALDASLRWYEANRSRLLRRHRGKYVAIIDDTVIDADGDFAALARRVFDRRGVRSVFMPRVEPEEPLVRVRSPRRARP